MASRKRVVEGLLERHGQTYSEELGIDLSKNTPSPLFRWLVASTMLSARIGAGLAMQGARALADAGLTTVDKMAAATWEERVRILNENGYARYDERTSRMLGETSAFLQETYGGDLRKLREAAGGDLADLRRRLKACKGLGDVGVDIFFREVQVAWDELFPFAGDRALNAAKELGLPDDPQALSRLVSRGDYVRLIAALIRTDLAKDSGEVLAASEQG